MLRGHMNFRLSWLGHKDVPASPGSSVGASDSVQKGFLWGHSVGSSKGGIINGRTPTELEDLSKLTNMGYPDTVAAKHEGRTAPLKLPGELSVRGAAAANGSLDSNVLAHMQNLNRQGEDLDFRRLNSDLMRHSAVPEGIPQQIDVMAALAIRPEIMAVHGRLGAGSFAEVFHCSLSGSQQQVAVKVLRKVSSTSQRREVELLGQLKHESLVQCYSVINGSLDAFVLELCSGGSLDRLLHGEAAQQGGLKSLGLRPRAQAMTAILSALEYLHAQHVVHRDMKSGNVFLTSPVAFPAETLPPVKLGDLGLARVVDDHMTQCTGTWRYMAPEVLMSNEYTESADVFSCGILLHELMSGKVPFGELSALRVAAAISTGHRPDPNDIVGPGPITSALGAVLEACWAEEPTERPSAAYLRQCLRPLAEGS